jgi:hypothetical protein
MTELFPSQEVAMDSPRLAFLKRHQLTTRQLPGGDLAVRVRGGLGLR